MSYINRIKDNVCFPEKTAVTGDEIENPLFDISDDEISEGLSYCKVLINKILNLPYAQLPDF